MPKLFFISLLALLSLTACSGDKKQYVIAVSSCSNDMWREKLNEELTVSTYMYDNVQLKIQSANDDDKRQIAQIDSFISQNVDLLIVSPNQLKTISPAIDRAYEKKIPVLLFDRKTDTDKYTAYIGADNFKVGRDMGEHVAKIMNGRGNLAVINGLRGSSPAIERRRGFMSAISQFPGIKIVGEGYAGWVYDEAEAVMDSILNSTTDIDCVFAQNDRMALGARHVVQRKGLKHHIDYVGIDALPVKGGGIECVDSGLLTASYIYPTRGDLVMSLAMKILTGKPFERENSLQGALVTKDNAKVLMLQNEELSKQRERLYAVHDKIDSYFLQYSHQRVYTILAAIIIVLLLLTLFLVYRNALTRRRITEEAVEAKLSFFTNVSHELRTPLTLIADPVNRLLHDDSIGKGQRSLLALVKKNVDVMMRLVDEILDFRKVQNGKMDMRLSAFNLSESIEGWVSRFSLIAEKKHISLAVNAPEPINMIADRDKVGKMVTNLLSNALKYTPDGGKIDVGAQLSGDKVTITVTDNGQGMTPSDAAHAFDSFWQAKSAVVGTGIGLALVRAFAEMHGGSVSVHSQEGLGSTFSIVLPLEQQGELAHDEPRIGADSRDEAPSAYEPLEGAEPTAADKITNPESQEAKPVVLVIDDNADVLAYVAFLLHEHYEVLQARDGNEGLKRAITEVPDVVVCDVMMPGIDGHELCRRLKRETATSHIPVLLLTAQSMEEQRAEGYDCGADGYLTKPFSGTVLLARLRNLLDNRQKLKQLYSGGNIPEVKDANPDSQFMADFQRILLSRLGDPKLSVEDLSAELGLSRVQMYRKVKALTGATPVELIRTMRLKRAERLLSQGGRNVSEVAYEVGFSSPSYFARCFKEHFGHLPSEQVS